METEHIAVISPARQFASIDVELDYQHIANGPRRLAFRDFVIVESLNSSLGEHGSGKAYTIPCNWRLATGSTYQACAILSTECQPHRIIQYASLSLNRKNRAGDSCPAPGLMFCPPASNCDLLDANGTDVMRRDLLKEFINSRIDLFNRGLEWEFGFLSDNFFTPI
jgi:hypothetical protein